MAKPTFAKLGLTKNAEVKTFVYAGQEIEVRQYLPIEERLELIGNAINNVLATDENKFPNYIKLDMYLRLEMIFKYTNLVFTEKQKEDLPKLYDLLAGNHIFELVDEQLPDYEYVELKNDTWELMEGLYKYNNSAYGILNNFMANYQTTDEEIKNAQQELKNFDNLDLVKNIITKLG